MGDTIQRWVLTVALFFPTTAYAQRDQTSDRVKQALFWLNFAHIGIPSGYTIIETSVKPQGTTNATVGFSYRDGGRKEIFIAQWSDTYKRAASGVDKEAAITLASVIVHEISHMEDGPSVSQFDTEQRAYDAEINALKQMGAKASVIETVKLAKRFTLNHLRSSVRERNVAGNAFTGIRQQLVMRCAGHPGENGADDWNCRVEGCESFYECGRVGAHTRRVNDQDHWNSQQAGWQPCCRLRSRGRRRRVPSRLQRS